MRRNSKRNIIDELKELFREQYSMEELQKIAENYPMMKCRLDDYDAIIECLAKNIVSTGKAHLSKGKITLRDE